MAAPLEVEPAPGTDTAAAAAAAAEVERDTGTARPWVTVVWDDPVNLMHYVTYVLQKLFGFDKARATELMMQVHTQGRATVTSGAREKMEGDAKRLQSAGLWATVQQD